MNRQPIYYKDFKCIASACTDSCCKDWEIDIDEETLECYRQVQGAFGERLRAHIFVPGETEEELPHFIQTETERCPFLNEEGLCDIFIHLGEEYLSQICTHHPRYYDWFLDGSEQGLGLCCEEAARLILSEKSELPYETVGEAEEETCDGNYDFESSLEKMLFQMREEMFDCITRGETFLDSMNHMYRWAQKCQQKYEEFLYGQTQEEEIEETVFTEKFFHKDRLEALIDYFRNLEINDMSWWKILGELKEHLAEVLESRRLFENSYGSAEQEYKNLLRYFVFRYFMKAREDDDIEGKIYFAAASVSMIYLLDIYFYLQHHKLELRDQINICKLYSKEIEYDEDNVRALYDYRYETF